MLRRLTVDPDVSGWFVRLARPAAQRSGVPAPSADAALQRAAEAVRALALERVREPRAGELRASLASGELGADEFLRVVVRDWVRAERSGADGGGGLDVAYEHLLGLSPRLTIGPTPESCDVAMVRSRSARRTRAGAFYTPAPLIDWLLDAALEPVIADARARRPGDPDGVLALRVCDPACGSGRFLAAAAGRLAAALARDRAAPGEPTPAHGQTAVRDVLRRCVYGVDIDDVAVELCRASLAGMVENGESVRAELDLHIREGDALLGARPEVLASGDRSRERADAWCGQFFGGARVERTRGFFHWFLEFPDVFGAEGVGGCGDPRASPSLDGLDAHQAFSPPRCGGGSWGSPVRGGFDVVVGNPPFLNQLQSATAADAGERALLRARFAGAVRGYADTAAAFLLLATEMTRPEGRVGLVLPRSLLAVEHAGRVRARVLEGAAPTALWASRSGAKGKAGAVGGAVGGAGFAGASVTTCALALHKGGPRCGTLRRAAGPAFDALAPLDLDADDLSGRPSWSHLLADADGVPSVVVRTTRTIGDLADATADFRDQYYGLRGLIIDDPAPHPRRPKLITSGLIAPLESLWGRVPTRIHKKAWLHPRVDLDALDAAARTDPEMRRLAAWAKTRLVPKLLMATQTRVLEVLPDPEGELLPCVPVITIVPKDAADLSRIAELLSSPTMSAIALTRHAGAGMSVDAIKLSAKQVLALPVIDDHDSGGLDAQTLAVVSAWWSRRAKRTSDDSGPGSAPSGRPRAPGEASAR